MAKCNLKESRILKRIRDKTSSIVLIMMFSIHDKLGTKFYPEAGSA